jgi:hypothetical protein
MTGPIRRGAPRGYERKRRMVWDRNCGDAVNGRLYTSVMVMVSNTRFPWLSRPGETVKLKFE